MDQALKQNILVDRPKEDESAKYGLRLFLRISTHFLIYHP